MNSLYNAKKAVLGIGILILLSGCLTVCAYIGSKFRNVLEPSQEQTEFIFEQYILSSISELSLTDVSNLSVKSIGMGQGVYIRFETNENFISEMLNSRENQHPYESISCSEFFDAYPTDIAAAIEWWTPQEVTTPSCYYDRERKYLLIDHKNGVVFFYTFPDFVG